MTRSTAQKNFSLTIYLIILFLLVLFTSTAVADSNNDNNLHVQDRGLVSIDVSHDAILSQHSLFSKNATSQAALQPTFAFLTPWNKQGNVFGKQFAKKFTHLAPVWFQCKAPRTKYQCVGDHEVKQNLAWLKQVKEVNPQIKIVPRVELLEQSSWTRDDYAEFLTSHRRIAHAEGYISQLVKLVTRNNLDGIVLEWGYLPLRQVYPVIEHLVKELSKFLKKKNKEFYIVAPAPLGYKLDSLYQNANQHLFSAKDFADLAPHVDGVITMTYDFTSLMTQVLAQAKKSVADVPELPLGSIAPLTWVSDVSDYLTSLQPALAHKLFIGLNFYGQDYTVTSNGQLAPNPIISDQYLKLIKQYQPQIKWDEKGQEHYFEYVTSNAMHKVYYPSLKSIDERLKVARSKKNGVAIWEIGQGQTWFFDLF